MTENIKRLPEWMRRNMSLQKMTEWVYNSALTGMTECPCCLFRGQVRKRAFNSRHARRLATLYELHLEKPDQFWSGDFVWDLLGKKFRPGLIGNAGSEYFDLWGLEDTHPPDPEAGYKYKAFRINAMGISFITGVTPIQKYHYVFQGHSIVVPEPDLTRIFINEVKDFDLNEVLGPAQ